MKVKFTAEAKKFITVAELPIVKTMISEMKDDEMPIEEYGKQFARIASGSFDDFEILKASAEIAKNNRVYNQYSEESGNLDIWMAFYAYNRHYGFYDIGVYLSDLWKYDGTEETAEEIRSNMYIQAFKKER